MRKQILCMMLCACVCAKCWGGVFEPIEPPIEKPETPTTPPSTEDLLTIKIEDEIMAVVGTNTWKAIAYGNGKYVAVGTNGSYDNGYITTSIDGINWTTPQRVFISHTASADIAYIENDNFAIIDNDKKIFIIDSATCKCIDTEQIIVEKPSTSQSHIVCDITNGQLFATADCCIYRKIGNTWEKVVNGRLSYYVDLTYANGRFIALDNQGNVAYSIDGLSWESSIATTKLTSCRHIVYGNGIYACCSNAGQLYTSVDLNTWIKGVKLSPQAAFIPLYDGQQFILIVNNYDKSCDVYTSKDYVTWSEPHRLTDELGNTVTISSLNSAIVCSR